MQDTCILPRPFYRTIRRIACTTEAHIHQIGVAIAKNAQNEGHRGLRATAISRSHVKRAVTQRGALCVHVCVPWSRCACVCVCFMNQDSTVGYLSFGPIEKNIYVFCDLSVREKDWRSRARGAKAT